jgi:HAMP domain-containing protein
MRLRYKFIALYSCIFLIVLALVGLSMFTQYRLQKLSEAALRGQELLEQSRKVRQITKDVMIGAFAPETYGNLKDVLYFDVYTTAIRSWKDASNQFQNQFRVFMDDPTLLQLVRRGILNEEYSTAELMSQKAFGKLMGLQGRLQKIQDAGLLGEDLYFSIQSSSDSDLIALFDEARQTSYYLANSFESFLNYFIQALDGEAQKIRKSLIQSFIVLGLIGALLAALIPLVFSARIVRRLKTLGNALYTVAEGDFSTPLVFNTGDEFQELASHFNRYTNLLKEHLGTLVSIARHISEKTLGTSHNTNVTEAGIKTVLTTALELLNVDGSAFISKESSGYHISYQATKNNHYTHYFSEQYILSLITSSTPDDTKGPFIALTDTRFTAGKLLQGIFIVFREHGNYNDLDRIRFENFLEFAALLITNAKTYEALVEERSAEYQTLQSQVQPHFLYNVLGGFAALNRMGERASLERSILALKDMLRYTLHHAAIATIAEEVEFIQKYLELQKMRFQDRLSWHISVDPDLLTVTLPKLIIQPFVENAIIHGIEPSGDPGTVSIVIQKIVDKNEMWVQINIDDTGVGFHPAINKHGVGLSNVERRLQLYYTHQTEGSKANYSIQSQPGKGCHVEIHLPLDSSYL